jgi:hypothetical protein
VNPLENSKIHIQAQTRIAVTTNFHSVDICLRCKESFRPNKEVSDLGRARIGLLSVLRRSRHSGSSGGVIKCPIAIRYIEG